MSIKLNWKHILFHFLGFWFFAQAFKMFAFLNNLNAAETIRLSKTLEEISSASSLSKLVVNMAIGFTLGYLVALCLCFVVSRKIKGSYINSIIAFLVFIVLVQLGWTGWSFLKQIFLLPGSFVNGSLYYIINGLVLLALGIIFIFVIRRFYIMNDKGSHVKASVS